MLRLLKTAALVSAIGASAAECIARPEVKDPELGAWLEKRSAEVAPSAAEKAFDRIGWAKDIREAMRLSRESGRPVFLFTMDGRINTGRC